MTASVAVVEVTWTGVPGLRIDGLGRSVCPVRATVPSHWVQASVLLREIKIRGQSDGISQVKTWIATFKQVEHHRVVRSDTTRQANGDFTTVRDPLHPKDSNGLQAHSKRYAQSPP